MHSITRKRASRLPLLVIVLASLALAATGCGDDYMGEQIVQSYCTYGATSTAQRDGCISHTTIEQVRARKTSAALRATFVDRPDSWAERCVRSDSHAATCGYCQQDAGPMCFDSEKDELDAVYDELGNEEDGYPSLFLGVAECDRAYADVSARREAAGLGPQVR